MSTKMKTAGAYERLLAYNIKPSVQRIAIMEYLMEHPTHPSADEIYVSLSPAIPTLSKTTVYNTLKLFAEQGAAQMLTIAERNANFDGDTSSHAHFFCKQCGHIYDLDDVPGMDKDAACREKDGHQVLEAHYYYKGICRKCLDKQ